MAKSFGFVLVLALLAGLGGVVLYLLSDINHRRYRLVPAQGNLVVERGRMLPLGYKPFRPEDEALGQAYAPIPLPPAATVEPSEIFDDRTDLDRALFAMLSNWIRDRLTSEVPGDLDLALAYARRTELLAGLSEEQRQELRTLRGDLAYRNGRHLLSEVVAWLNKARAEFEVSMQLGTSHPNDAQRWIAEIERRIDLYNTGSKLDQLAQERPPFAEEAPPERSKPAAPASPAEPGEQDTGGKPRWSL